MAEWDGYRVFLSVAEHRSFSAAGRALGLSQPTVGRTIAGLESSLGVRLFVRSARGLVPTPEAERMLDDVRRMADAARDAEHRASRAQDSLEGLVRISTSEGLGSIWLVRRLEELRALHPGLRIELVLSNQAVDLGRREADLAMRLFRPTEPDLVIRKAGIVRFGLYASAAYLERAGTPRRLADLARHDLIGFPRARGVPAHALWFSRLAAESRFVVVTSNLLAQSEAARTGLGIVLGTEALLEDDPSLRRILPRTVIPHLDLYLASHEDVRRTPRVAAVYDALLGFIAASRLAR